MTTEQYRPQVSKREEAIQSLTRYFCGYIVGITNKGHIDDEGIVTQARQNAEHVYRIVKRAEGFDA